MTDLVERLRKYADNNPLRYGQPMLREAAAEIERLEKLAESWRVKWNKADMAAQAALTATEQERAVTGKPSEVNRICAQFGTLESDHNDLPDKFIPINPDVVGGIEQSAKAVALKWATDTVQVEHDAGSCDGDCWLQKLIDRIEAGPDSGS